MSKRLTAILIVAIVIVILVILGSNIFSVKEIGGSYPQVEHFTQNDIAIAADSIIGMNIFRVSKEKVAESVEKSVPYAKVKLVEKRFPNVVWIYSDVRIGLIAVPISKPNEETFSHYAIIDEDLKILEVLDETNSRLLDYTILVGLPFASEFDDLTLLKGEVIDASEGDFFVLKNIIKTVKSLNTSLAGEGFSEFFKYIDFERKRAEELIYFVLQDSKQAFSISKNNLTTDLQKALSWF